MTPEREAEIREVLSGNASPAAVRVERAAYDLLAEIDRLRSLPVLRTCVECVHLYRRGRSCEHPTAATPGEARHVDPSHTPPSWCPLRGAR